MPAPAVPDPEFGTAPAQQALSLGGAVPADPVSPRVLALQQRTARRAQEHADLQRDLLRFHIAPSGRPAREVRDEQAAADLACAAALRCDVRRARALIAGAVTATQLPGVFALLAAAAIPAPWFDRILRHAASLDPRRLGELDQALAALPLRDMSYGAFRRRLRLLVTRLTEADRPRSSRRTGRVAWREPDLVDGTMTLEVTGPLDRMTEFGARINAAARAVQDQQRRALRDGEARIPFDVDEEVQQTGMPLSLGELRYEILTRSVLDTGTAPVPATECRITLTVPALTLMGRSNEPGLLDGDTPIPATMARGLAARSTDWHRVLVDPATGAYLPGASQRYRPTPEMIEQVRMTTPVCAAPGCLRPSRGRSEVDHIEEFDHDDPGSGGPTDPENLHSLCVAHHRIKTGEHIDPVRISENTTRWRLGRDLTVDILDNTDLVTPTLLPEYRDLIATFIRRPGASGHIHLGNPAEETEGDPPPF